MKEKSVVLRYEDPETGEVAQYPISKETLTEIMINISDVETSNFAEWCLRRMFLPEET